MLTEYVCVYLLLVNVVYLCKAGTKADSIKNSSCTEYLILGESGVLKECVGKDIYGVCYENVNSVGSNLYDFL